MRTFRKLLSLALVLSMLAGFAMMGGFPVASAKEETKTVVTTTQEVKAEALEAEPTYTDVIYYVNGNSSWEAGDGKTAETALQGSTVAVFNKVKSDLGSLQSFPNGSRLVVRVIGGIGNNNQYIGTSEVLKCLDGTPVPILFEGYGTGTNSIISTHKPANAGSCYWFTYNDVTFRNIRLKANAYKPSGSDTYSEFITCNFYANGHNVVFDKVTFASDSNCTSTTRQKWNIGADTAVGPTDTTKAFDGSITFLNGTYTGLGNVSAVLSNSWWRSDANGKTLYAHENATCTLTIGEGAVMGDVFGTYGNIQVKQVTVNLAGGSVKNYRGTQNGKETALRVYKTNLTTNVSGTVISENYYFGLGTYNDFTGNVVNNITGGIGAEKTFYGANTGTKVTGNLTNIVSGDAQIKAYSGFLGASVSGTLTSTVSGNAVVNSFFAGSNVGSVKLGNMVVNVADNAAVKGNFYSISGSATVSGDVTTNLTGGTITAKKDVCFGCDSSISVAGTVTTNMSGTTVNVLADETNSSGVYFGGKNLTAQNVTNNVTGGTITFTDNRTDTSKGQKYVCVHFAPSSGTVKGTLTNNVSGITVNGKLKTATTVYFGGQSLGWRCNKIVNTLGLQGVANSGPVFNTGSNIYLAGGWAMVGETTATSTQGLPETSVCTDDVVISNTVYDITMNTSVCLYGGSSDNYYLNDSTVHNHHIKGSIVTNIYGGKIGTLYGAGGNVPVYGHVTTNIYGGTFASINGTSASGNIYDGAELHIFKAAKTGGTAAVNVSMKPYETKNTEGSMATVSALTSGRKAAVLTVEAAVPTDAVIGVITLPADDAQVTISKASFPSGLKVNSAAATSDMIASGSYVVTPQFVEMSLADAATAACYVSDTIISSITHCDCGTRTQNSDPTGNCKGGCDGTVRTWMPWVSTDKLPSAATEAGFYYLTGDVTTTGQTSFKADATNTYTVFGIDLNGYNITHAVPAGTKDGARALVAFGGYNADATNAANTWKTDLIITDTAAVHGSVISDQSALTAANTSMGNVLWVRHGNVRVYNVTLDGSDANTTNDGAAVYMDSGRTLNMYNTTVIGGTTTSYGGAITVTSNDTLTMTSCTVTGGKASHGGAIFAGENATVILNNTTVSGGEATASGGNIYCNAGSTVTLNNCTVTGGKAASTAGGNIHEDGSKDKAQTKLTINGGTVGTPVAGYSIYIGRDKLTVTGAPEIDEIYLRTGMLANAPYFEVDLNDVTGGSIGVNMETAGLFGACDPSAEDYITCNKTYWVDKDKTEKAFFECTFVNGKLYLTKGEDVPAATFVDENGIEQSYATLAEAVANVKEGQIVKLTGDITDDITVPAGQSLNLDVSGCILRGNITVDVGEYVYLIDSATDKYGELAANQGCYAVIHGGSYFVGSFKAPNAKRYFVQNKAAEGAAYPKIVSSRFYIGVTHMYFGAIKMGAGYKAQIAGNSEILNNIADIDDEKGAFGMKFSVPTASDTVIYIGATADKFTTGAEHWSATYQVNNIMSKSVDAAANAQRAQTAIVAQVYINFAGSDKPLESAEYTFTLKTMVETADDQFSTMSASGQAALKVMYKTWATEMAEWDLTNIQQAASGQ